MIDPFGRRARRGIDALRLRQEQADQARGVARPAPRFEAQAINRQGGRENGDMVGMGAWPVTWTVTTTNFPVFTVGYGNDVVQGTANTPTGRGDHRTFHRETATTWREELLQGELPATPGYRGSHLDDIILRSPHRVSPPVVDTASLNEDPPNPEVWRPVGPARPAPEQPVRRQIDLSVRHIVRASWKKNKAIRARLILAVAWNRPYEGRAFRYVINSDFGIWMVGIYQVARVDLQTKKICFIQIPESCTDRQLNLIRLLLRNLGVEATRRNDRTIIKAGDFYKTLRRGQSATIDPRYVRSVFLKTHGKDKSQKDMDYTLVSLYNRDDGRGTSLSLNRFKYSAHSNGLYETEWININNAPIDNILITRNYERAFTPTTVSLNEPGRLSEVISASDGPLSFTLIRSQVLGNGFGNGNRRGSGLI